MSAACSTEQQKQNNLTKQINNHQPFILQGFKNIIRYLLYENNDLLKTRFVPSKNKAYLCHDDVVGFSFRDPFDGFFRGSFHEILRADGKRISGMTEVIGGFLGKSHTHLFVAGVYQHLPRGANQTLRGGELTPFSNHLAPFGRSRYNVYTVYNMICIYKYNRGEASHAN